MNQLKFNPYAANEYREPDSALFDLGRRLQRLRFHLQQAWLLGDAEGIVASYAATRQFKSASQIRWLACQRQFQRADKVCAHLSTAVYSIDAEDPGWLSEKIHRHARALVDDAFPERCYEVFEDLRSSYRPDAREQQYQECIDQNVGIVFQTLRQDVRTSVAEKRRQILQAGIVLEEGLSRRDIHCFLPPPRADLDEMSFHLSLDDEIDGLEAREGKPLELWDSYEVDASPDPIECKSMRNVDYEAGQLPPEARWQSKLIHAWAQAGLTANHVSQLATPGLRRLPTGTISAAIERSHDHACRQLSSSVGCDRLKVDVDNTTLTLDGTTYAIEQEAIYVFAELLKAPDHLMPFAEIKRKHPQVFGKGSRLDRIRASLPWSIRKILGSAKGKACQIELPEQQPK